MARGAGLPLENNGMADLPAGPVVEAVLATGAAMASGATTAALTGTVGTVGTVGATGAAAASACGSGGGPDAVAPSAKEAPEQVAMEVCPQEPGPELKAAARWDAHLDHPSPQTDPKVGPEAQAARRGRYGLSDPAELKFIETFEFISLGCYCAPSYALQLLGVKRYSYPFDWVRSSLDGVLHCLDVQFQDFLTYSTTWTQDQYMVFGGTRWGGSFWHHNVEAPVTESDMIRRVQRLYGRGEVPPSRPRLYVRSVNSTKEVDAALRFRDALRQMVPEAAEVLLLLIVDMQSAKGPMAVAGEAGRGVLFYQIAEADTSRAVAQGANGLHICSESYAEAVAFAIKYWSGNAEAQASVPVFPCLRDLSASCVQWDGGDPCRELFTPRKFYGRMMGVMTDLPKMRKLCAPLQMFNFVLQADVSTKLPLQVECFGKYLQVGLPEGSVGGHVLQLFCNEGQLSGTVGLLMQDGQVLPLGAALVEEREAPATEQLLRPALRPAIS